MTGVNLIIKDENGENDVEAIADTLATRPPVDWEACGSLIVENLENGERLRLVNELLARAEKYARVAAYIERYDSTHVHGQAVKRQNRVGRVLRQAFGFTYPEKADINF